MTLAELNAKMVKGVSRPDIADDEAGTEYTSYLNEAQREICQSHSFRWMKEQTDLTIAAGQTYVAMPADFKEFTPGRSPVHLVDESSGSEVVTPVDVWLPEKQKRRFGFTPTGQLVVSLNDKYQPPRLEIIGTSEEDLVFRCTYFAIPDDLADDADTNQLTELYPLMLLAKAKALAFEDVSDPAAADFEQLYEIKLAKAKAHDRKSRVSGVALRM